MDEGRGKRARSRRSEVREQGSRVGDQRAEAGVGGQGEMLKNYLTTNFFA